MDTAAHLLLTSILEDAITVEVHPRLTLENHTLTSASNQEHSFRTATTLHSGVLVGTPVAVVVFPVAHLHRAWVAGVAIVITVISIGDVPNRRLARCHSLSKVTESIRVKVKKERSLLACVSSTISARVTRVMYRESAIVRGRYASVDSNARKPIIGGLRSIRTHASVAADSRNHAVQRADFLGSSSAATSEPADHDEPNQESIHLRSTHIELGDVGW